MVFSYLKDGRQSLAVQSADAAIPPHVVVPGSLVPSSLTPDGRQVAAVDAGGDIHIVTLEGELGAARPLFQTTEIERWPEVSPDGRWLAYGSNVSGRYEVWVKAYPTGDAVPVEAGSCPAWHPNGRELFFLSRLDPSGTRRMMAVGFTPGSPRPTIGRPRELFEFDERQLAFACSPVRCYDVAPDGRRFYVVQTANLPPPPVVAHVNLITNWFEELKAKVPPAR